MTNQDSQEAVISPTEIQPASIRFTPEEMTIFEKLIASSDTPEELIPANMDPATLWQYFNATGKGLDAARRSTTRLKPLLGRTLVLIQQHPHLYQSYGYHTYSDFMKIGVPKFFGISRPEAFNCTKVARTLSFMPAEQMEGMGFSTLNVLATAIWRDTDNSMTVEMIQERRAHWVQRAQNTTIDELKAEMVAHNLAEPGELDKTTVVIQCNVTTKETWERLSGNAEIRAYCETDAPGGIFDRMMAEVENEWMAQAAESTRV